MSLLSRRPRIEPGWKKRREQYNPEAPPMQLLTPYPNRAHKSSGNLGRRRPEGHEKATAKHRRKDPAVDRKRGPAAGGVRRSCSGFETSVIAPGAQAVTHRPHPTHRSRSSFATPSPFVFRNVALEFLVEVLLHHFAQVSAEPQRLELEEAVDEGDRAVRRRVESVAPPDALAQ